MEIEKYFRIMLLTMGAVFIIIIPAVLVEFAFTMHDINTSQSEVTTIYLKN